MDVTEMRPGDADFFLIGTGIDHVTFASGALSHSTQIFPTQVSVADLRHHILKKIIARMNPHQTGRYQPPHRSVSEISEEIEATEVPAEA